MVVGSIAIAVAERGAPSSSTSSPKTRPGPRIVSVPSRPSSDSTPMRTRPVSITCSRSPGSPSWNTTSSARYRRRTRWRASRRAAASSSDRNRSLARRGARIASLAMASRSVIVRPGSVRGWLREGYTVDDAVATRSAVVPGGGRASTCARGSRREPSLSPRGGRPTSGRGRAAVRWVSPRRSPVGSGRLWALDAAAFSELVARPQACAPAGGPPPPVRRRLELTAQAPVADEADASRAPGRHPRPASAPRRLALLVTADRAVPPATRCRAGSRRGGAGAGFARRRDLPVTPAGRSALPPAGVVPGRGSLRRAPPRAALRHRAPSPRARDPGRIALRSSAAASPPSACAALALPRPRPARSVCVPRASARPMRIGRRPPSAGTPRCGAQGVRSGTVIPSGRERPPCRRRR